MELAVDCGIRARVASPSHMRHEATTKPGKNVTTARWIEDELARFDPRTTRYAQGVEAASGLDDGDDGDAAAAEAKVVEGVAAAVAIGGYDGPKEAMEQERTCFQRPNKVLDYRLDHHRVSNVRNSCWKPRLEEKGRVLYWYRAHDGRYADRYRSLMLSQWMKSRMNCPRSCDEQGRVQMWTKVESQTLVSTFSPCDAAGSG